MSDIVDTKLAMKGVKEENSRSKSLEITAENTPLNAVVDKRYGSLNPVSCPTLDIDMLMKNKTDSSILIPGESFEKEKIFSQNDDFIDAFVQRLPTEVPNPFHVTVPGYKESQCSVIRKEDKKKIRDRFLGPDITNIPLTWTPKYLPDPNFESQAIGYNWEKQMNFRLDKVPYANALFKPIDPQVSMMYNQMVPWCAYPYGVPVIEEPKKSFFKRFFCCGETDKDKSINKDMHVNRKSFKENESKLQEKAGLYDIGTELGNKSTQSNLSVIG